MPVTPMAAVELLGTLVQIERKSRKMTAQELAERLGVDRSTLQRFERGDPKVELGLAFEACAILALPLFEEDAKGLAARRRRSGQARRAAPKPCSPPAFKRKR